MEGWPGVCEGVTRGARACDQPDTATGIAQSLSFCWGWRQLIFHFFVSDFYLTFIVCVCPLRYQASDGRLGSANFSACMAVVQQVLPPRVCAPSAHEGSISSHGGEDRGADGRRGKAATKCTFAGVHLPAVIGAEFIGIEVRRLMLLLLDTCDASVLLMVS